MSQRVKQDNVTVNELIARGTAILDAYKKQDAKIDARLLAMHLLECNMAELLLHADRVIVMHMQESYMYMIAKRAQGIPLQYITKNQEFMGLPFYVDERVLIPRQDTEVLVETLLDYAKHYEFAKGLEIGVGSGCISISLAHYVPELVMTGIDICEDALTVAKKNALTNQVESRITFLKSDIFANYEGDEESLDFIVSNPPYITREECKELMIEVKEYEPLKALTDGGDGLYFYREITKASKKWLKPQGLLAYEIGYLQGEAVCDILKNEGFEKIEVIKDLQGHDRVVLGTKI